LSKSHIANFGILKEIQNCIHFCYRESIQNKGANYAGSKQGDYEIHNKNIQYPYFFRYANILKFSSFSHKNLGNGKEL